MSIKKVTTSILALTLVSQSIIPAFAAQPNEIVGTPGTGSSSVTLDVKDDGSGGGDTPAPDPGEIIVATVPVELPIVMNLKGDITVPTEAKIINHSSNKIQVKEIETIMENGWTAVEFNSEVATVAENTKELGLSFRNDKMIADGSFTLTPGNWNIEANGDLALNMAAQIPIQTVESKGKIATVSFTLAEGSTDGGEVNPPAPDPVPEKVTVTFTTDEKGSLMGDTTTQINKGEVVTSFPTPEAASLRYEFDKWVDSNSNTEITTSTPITSDTVIKAIFNEKAASQKNWFITDGANTITGLSDEYLNMVNAPTDLVIPNNIGGSSITTIAPNAFANKDILTSVIVPSSVTTIGENAFSGCTSLTEINLDYAVKYSIANKPWGVSQDIVKWKPSEDWDINPISSEELGDLGLRFDSGELRGGDKDSGHVIVPSSVDGIKVTSLMSAYSDNDKITSVVIPSTVTRLSNAFSSCNNIRHIEIPSSVTEIVSSLTSCKNLESITSHSTEYTTKDNRYLIKKSNNELIAVALKGIETAIIPDGVEILGGYSLANSSEINSVVIPSTVIEIKDMVFYNSNAGNIEIPNSVKKIGMNAFVGSKITSIRIPDSVTEIPAGAFSGCTQLTQVSLPDSLTTIGPNAFKLCTSLESITLPDSLTTIGPNAFIRCGSLRTFNIPKNIDNIPNGALEGCVSIENIKIPENIKLIGDRAFYGCSSLKSIQLPNSLRSIGELAFANDTNLSNKVLTEITIPSSVESIGVNCLWGHHIKINYSGKATGYPWGSQPLQ